MCNIKTFKTYSSELTYSYRYECLSISMDGNSYMCLGREKTANWVIPRKLGKDRNGGGRHPERAASTL